MLNPSVQLRGHAKSVLSKSNHFCITHINIFKFYCNVKPSYSFHSLLQHLDMFHLLQFQSLESWLLLVERLLALAACKVSLELAGSYLKLELIN